GGDQVDPVAERGRFLGAVGIVGHEREAGGGEASADHPVVAADGLQLLLLLEGRGGEDSLGGGGGFGAAEAQRAAEGVVDGQNLRAERGILERRIEGDVGVGGLKV